MARPRVNNLTAKGDDLKTKKAYFKRKFPGFKKKATELAVLCGNSVAFICHGPDNSDLHVWPEPQENPEALAQIVAKFNRQSDQKRKKYSCDLSNENSNPDLDGLSVEELNILLSNTVSHLAGVRQKKAEVILRMTGSSSSGPKPSLVSEDINFGIRPKETEEHLRVSDNTAAAATVSTRSSGELGFGGVFDELGYVVSACVSNAGVSVIRGT